MVNKVFVSSHYNYTSSSEQLQHVIQKPLYLNRIGCPDESASFDFFDAPGAGSYSHNLGLHLPKTHKLGRT